MDKVIEELLYYASKNLLVDDNDLMFKRNILLHELNIDEPYHGEIDKTFIDSLDNPKELIEKLDISSFDKEKIMSIISLSPSELIKRIKDKYNNSPKEATSFFYEYMIKNYYIKKENINKNIKYNYKGELSNLEITINLSKPEKDNKDIAKAREIVSTSYPKCPLCYENIGYYGSSRINGRTNIRIYPIKLNNEDWFIQYSPYAYYDEHLIIINKEHTPMIISDRTIKNELEFVDLFPHYFIGSNADLPIVGGSLLSHEHYQGGGYVLPLMLAKDKYKLVSKKYKNISISYLDFYNSTIKLEGNSKEEIISCYLDILNGFKKYNDETIDLISNDIDGPHSTCTVITRKVNEMYQVFMILRNNRCSDLYKDGIFHAHNEYHNIKKEGIGLIEAMGLFILPGRLKNELSKIEYLLNSSIDINDYIKNNEELIKHQDFIHKLIEKYGRNNTNTSQIIQNEIGSVCENILYNTGIFKNDDKGQRALFNFLNSLSLEVKND